MSTYLPITDHFGLTWNPEEAYDDRVNVVEQENIVIATLRGDFASRLLQLFLPDRRGARLTDFNCFGTVRFLLAHTDRLTHDRNMAKCGAPQYVHDAIRCMETPFVFQIRGDSKEGKGWAHDIALHAGIVLGSDSKGEPVIVDKDCYRSLYIRRFVEANTPYFPSCNPRQFYAHSVTCARPEEVE